MTDQPFKILVVGGGAGGLELACKLGRKWGAERVALVDAKLFHIWKPSLHEVAAGTLDIHQEGLSYQMLAHDNGFSFLYGPMTGLDTARARAGRRRGDGRRRGGAARTPHRLRVAGAGDRQRVQRLRRAGRRRPRVLAGRPAGRRALPPAHAAAAVAGRRAQERTIRRPALDIVIIGGGATGVELAAELREASSLHAQYGLRHIDAARDVRIRILEGAPRLLAPLAENVSDAATRLLGQRHVDVNTSCRVVRVDANQVTDADGNVYPADLCVWAAGIKAPPLLAEVGLPVTQERPGEGGRPAARRGRAGRVRVRRLRVVPAAGRQGRAAARAVGAPAGGLSLRAAAAARRHAIPARGRRTCSTTTARWCRSARARRWAA